MGIYPRVSDLSIVIDFASGFGYVDDQIWNGCVRLNEIWIASGFVIDFLIENGIGFSTAIELGFVIHPPEINL